MNEFRPTRSSAVRIPRRDLDDDDDQHLQVPSIEEEEQPDLRVVEPEEAGAAEAVKKMEDEETARLLEAAIQGHPGAFEALVQPYQRLLYARCYAILQDQQDAKDALQDTLIKIHRNLARVSSPAKFRGYIFRIAENAAKDLWRKRSRRRGREISENVGEEGSAKLTDKPYPDRPAHGMDPERAVRAQRMLDRIRGCMEQLPEDQRQVYEMHRFGGLKYKEIAQRLGIPEGTVMSRMFYARKKLQELLTELPSEL